MTALLAHCTWIPLPGPACRTTTMTHCPDAAPPPTHCEPRSADLQVSVVKSKRGPAFTPNRRAPFGWHPPTHQGKLRSELRAGIHRQAGLLVDCRPGQGHGQQGEEQADGPHCWCCQGAGSGCPAGGSWAGEWQGQAVDWDTRASRLLCMRSYGLLEGAAQSSLLWSVALHPNTHLPSGYTYCMSTSPITTHRQSRACCSWRGQGNAIAAPGAP